MPFRAGRFAKKLLIRLIALCGIFLLAAAWFANKCPPLETQRKPISQAAQQRRAVTADIKDYARPEENTYFTYPEWYIVWSYQEKADFQEKNLPASFPYFGEIKQYWGGYCAACGLARGKYPFNFGDHVMLAVIGSSFSFEYALRGVYEGTLGKLSEWLAGHQETEEDRYACKVARDYANFVHIRPFYEFSFASRLTGLWKETTLAGPHFARKWERKVFLSVDYGIEAFYCWMIEKATHASYGYEEDKTYVWIENASDQIFTENPRIRKVKEVGPGTFIVVTPRYQEFTSVVQRLSAQGVRFVEIAGNDEVLVTAIAPRAWTYDLSQGKLLFSTDILTQPASKRIAVRSAVASLHAVLNDLPGRGAKIEHVYDY